MMIFVATGWCPYCSQEAAYLESLSQKLAAQGVLILSIITEDPYGSSATPEFAKRYAQQFSWQFPVTVGNLASSYWGASSHASAANQTTPYPFHLFIDAQSMKITRTHIGALTSQEATHYLQQIVTRQQPSD
jgi:thiol-disulfide isomerase/thioredoxin